MAKPNNHEPNSEITCKTWQDFWNITAPNRCNITEAYLTDGHDKGIELSAHQMTFSGEIWACRVTGISYTERFVKWNFLHPCCILKTCGFRRQDVRQIFSLLRFSVRISFPNITRNWPITFQTCIQRHNVISVDPDSFPVGFISAIFFTLVAVEITTVYSLFFAVSTLYYATEKSLTFNGVQTKDFMAFGLKERLNWPFNVGFPRGENDARTADSREPCDSSTNQQQG